MAGEIRHAVERLEDRQSSAEEGAGVEIGEESLEQIDDWVRRMFSGLDIDIEELRAEMREVVMTFEAAASVGLKSTSGEAAGAKFADGIAIGLLIAEAREREAARS